MWRIKDLWFKMKMAWQRVFRGFDNEYLWSHSWEHAEMTSKALRILASKVTGCPPELWDDVKDGDPCHQWRTILIEIAEGFEAALAIENMDYMDGTKDWRDNLIVLKRKFNNGMRLYHKYYLSLWD